MVPPFLAFEAKMGREFCAVKAAQLRARLEDLRMSWAPTRDLLLFEIRAWSITIF
jgi:hypothetical protein